MTKLVIIGGSDAGMSAALRAKEVDSSSEVTVLVADSFPNYSICGLPFYLSGEVPDWHALAHRTVEEITREGIHLLLNHTAQTIDSANHSVAVVDEEKHVHQIHYDQLLVATGAMSSRPPIDGLNLPGVYLLHSMEDSFAIHRYLDTSAPHSAVIIGGGYIGLEMADALTVRGMSVTVVEHNASVLKTVDTSLGQLIEAELQRHGVEVTTDVAIERIEQAGMQLDIRGTHDFHRLADMVIIGVGVQPSSELAQRVGAACNKQGAIQVTRTMETTVPAIYAAGDCVETWHRLLQRPVYLPLGTTSHKQGRVAGENAVGGHREFAGSLGTQVVKVFEVVAARTGLNDKEAMAAGLTPLTVESTFWDHKVYYTGAHEVCIRLTGDKKTGRLLGAQMVGNVHGEIAKRIDIFATALFHGMSIDDINALDLSYTPPLGSPWDAVQMSAQAWVKQSRESRRVTL